MREEEKREKNIYIHRSTKITEFKLFLIPKKIHKIYQNYFFKSKDSEKKKRKAQQRNMLISSEFCTLRNTRFDSPFRTVSETRKSGLWVADKQTKDEQKAKCCV